MAITIGTTYTKLSEAGGVVCVSGRADEKIITAKADGSQKAGYVVSIVGTGAESATTGDIVATDKGVTESFVGIVLEKYNTDCDSAVTDGDLVEIVVPKAGKLYNIYITDPGADFNMGTLVAFSADAGEMVIQDSALEDMYYNAIFTQNVLNTSRFAEVRWV